MINTTPISSYNMQNAYQLGQIMQEQDAYTPSINPFSSSLAVPAGYSLNQWQQELSLAREQYFARPVMAAGNLLSTSAGTALLFHEMASGASGASAAFAQGVGRTIGEGVGWGVGQGIRGGLRFGESTANYITGGAFTKANNWIAGKTGFKFQRLSSVIDKGATRLNGWINAFNAQSDLLANTALRNETFSAMSAVARSNRTFAARAVELNSQLKAAKAAKNAIEAEKIATAIAENRAALDRGSKAIKAIYNSGLAKAAPGGLKAFKDISALTTRVGGAALGFIGTFFSPAFLLKQAVIDRAIDFGVESYENYNTRMDMHREILAKGGRILRFGDAMFSQGIDGGFSAAQREQLVNHLDRMAASDYTVRRNDWLGMGSWSVFGGHKRYSENLKELKALLSVSADMGMLDMSKSLDEVEKRFDTIVKAVKKMSRITGKSKGELAMALASTQQSEARFNINDAAASLQRKLYAATVSGASLQTILQESALGAQMGVQAGIGKAAGADFMISARNIYSRMYRKNMLDRGDIDMMGGEQGVVSGLAAGLMSMTNNNVYRSQIGMFFDMKTGKIDRRRMKAYINGDMKNTMNEALERNIAMNTMSFNPFTGREEIGGKLNARMDFVDRALQHGDIKMPELLGIAKQMMKENEAIWGKAAAQAKMMGYFKQTLGLDKAALIMRAMNDDSLMKPDLKEQLAVSRKQLEDRYAAEYARANNFWTKVGTYGGSFIAGGIAAALTASGPVGWGVLGVGLAANAIFGGKIKHFMLSHGSNALSPEMAKINSYDDWIFTTARETGIEKYNRKNELIVNTLENITDERLSEVREKVMAKARKTGKVKGYVDESQVGVKHLLYSYSPGQDMDIFDIKDSWSLDKIWNGGSLERLENYLVNGTDSLSKDDRKYISEFLKDKNTTRIAEKVTFKIMDQQDLKEEEARKLAAQRINRVLNNEFSFDTDNLEKVNMDAIIKAGGFKGAFNSKVKNYMDLAMPHLKAGMEDAVYRVAIAGREKTIQWYMDKGYSETEAIFHWKKDKKKAAGTVNSENYTFGWEAANSLIYDEEWRYSKLRKVNDALNKLGIDVSSDEIFNAAWNRYVKQTGKNTKSLEDIIADITSSESKTKEAILEYKEDNSPIKANDEGSNDEDKKVGNSSDSITGDSKLNQELLKTLKAINSTLTNMNTGMGYGSMQPSYVADRF